MIRARFLGGIGTRTLAVVTKFRAIAIAMLLASCRGTVATTPRDVPLVVYVSTTGRDVATGTTSTEPVATLERARDIVRDLRHGGRAVVEIAGGSYRQRGPLVLTAEDSAVVWRAADRQKVIVSGGVEIANLGKVTDKATLARIDPSACDEVRVAQLRGIGDFGSPQRGGVGVFVDGEPQTLARWPNEGFTRIADVIEGAELDVRGAKGRATGTIVYAGDRPERWVGEPDVWLHGAWFWDWADDRERVTAIETERHIIRLAPPYHESGYRKGQWYYAYNVLPELDRAGEWYLDRESGRLYVWPSKAGVVTVSVASTLVEIKGAHDVELRGITFEQARGDAIRIVDNSRDVLVDHCTIRGIGGWGVKVIGGVNDRVTDSEITLTGQGGILLDGGDRPRLLPARHEAARNHIHHYSTWDRTYQPGISLVGVGNVARNNLIHDAPHEAIELSGNDHLIERNEIHHVCEETNDAGAIYGGRDWSMRGTVIRENYLHDLTGFETGGCKAVMLDDMLSGIEVSRNLFVRVGWAVFVGGGRDNRVVNNVFVDSGPDVHVDARALNWAAYSLPTTMVPRLEAMPYRSSPWKDAYPTLPGLLRDEPGAPKGNVIAHNISWRGKWSELEPGIESLVKFEDNLVDEDPHFVDEARGDFRLRADSPAFARGFTPIALDAIGLRRR
jgi:hypothetical protein